MTDNKQREALIEESFKKHDAPTWDEDPIGRDAAIRWHMRGFNDALAVFEKAHAPTDDEREVIVRTILPAFDQLATSVYHDGPYSEAESALEAADLLVAAGFRRPVSPDSSGHRAILIQEARAHADEYRRYDDSEGLVGTLVEMANMLAAPPEPQGEPSGNPGQLPQGEPTDEQIHTAMEAQQAFTNPDGRSAMRAALRAAAATDQGEGENR